VVWEEMIELFSPESFSNCDTWGSISALYWVNSLSQDVFSTIEISVYHRATIVNIVFMTSPNSGHLSFLPVSEEAEVIT